MSLLYMAAFACDFPDCDGFLVGDNDFYASRARLARIEIRDRWGWKTVSAGGIRIELCPKHPKARAMR